VSKPKVLVCFYAYSTKTYLDFTAL
jgi:hypothetical protein